MNHTEDSVINVLSISKHWNYFKDIIVPRVHFFAWESDILIINGKYRRVANRGKLEEIEIKLSIEDLKADFKNKITKHKALKAGSTALHKFWFALPIDIVEEAKQYIPDYAGIISVGVRHRDVIIVKEAPSLKGGHVVGPQEKLRLLTSTYHRFWKLQEKRK